MHVDCIASTVCLLLPTFMQASQQASKQASKQFHFTMLFCIGGKI